MRTPSKGLTISGVAKTLGTKKPVGLGTRTGSMLFKTALAGFYLLLVTTASPTAIPIFVEAPTTAAEAPAKNNLGPRVIYFLRLSKRRAWQQ
jgi:hypothetical protein